MKAVREPAQTTQRVKVGMTGLAAVVLLIGLASAIISSVSRERPVAIAGSAQTDVVANMAPANTTADESAEPLAELGVAPATANSQTIR